MIKNAEQAMIGARRRTPTVVTAGPARSMPMMGRSYPEIQRRIFDRSSR
jgi:hypothetical protein